MDSHEDTPMGFWGSESESVIARQYPIHKACRDGDAVTLSRAVAVASPDQLVAEDQFYGWTPVHWAAYFGKVECLNGLLRTGVNVNIRTSRFQQTPAHIAAFGGHPTCLLELLKSGADFHARDYLGETPMHKAARVGNGECIKTLIQNGARANICNNNGHTAADLSRMQNFKECVNILDAASGQLAAQVSYNGLNGSHVLNGSSGCHVTNGNGFVTNGHNNGTNGHHNNGVTNRKRSYEDESIPLFKRARVAGEVNHQHNPLIETNHEPMEVNATKPSTAVIGYFFNLSHAQADPVSKRPPHVYSNGYY
uniref:ankyrin repeat domain-containing protein 10 isoform X4 n=1 Tax=Ciona intestinalis TaxID=7719 RepID=UPI00089DAA69|nr:ankyrin repeat domain-containing protein 10 isoform X4 [Ciona intestinalis]|eukprot:XP_018670327.1 ankyrin repeat domain-containing protein 10 isoform X4 [Ciona intestinalis]